MFYVVICLLSMTLLLAFPGVAHEGTEKGLTIFFDSLFPFLFPYLILSNWLIHLTFHKSYSLKFISLQTYVLSALGGYPIGAILLSKLVKNKQISKKFASYLLPIMHSPSPIFLFGFVSSEIIEDNSFSWTYFITLHCISFITLLILFKFMSKENYIAVQQTKKPFAFTQSMKDSINALCIIGANVIFFCTVFFVFEHVYLSFRQGDYVTLTLLASFLEITNGLLVAKDSLNVSALPIYAAIFLTVQSLSIHMQIWMIAKEQEISFKPYIAIRALYCVLVPATFLLFF